MFWRTIYWMMNWDYIGSVERDQIKRQTRLKFLQTQQIKNSNLVKVLESKRVKNKKRKKMRKKKYI